MKSHTYGIFCAILCIVVMTVSPALSDEAPGIEWQKCFGGSFEDSGETIQNTPGGGYIVAGYVHSSDGTFPGDHSSGDIWVAQLDSSGELGWRQYIGSSGNDTVRNIHPAFGSGHVLVGWTSSSDGFFSENHGRHDMLVTKIDTAGAVLWTKCYGGTGDDYGRKINQTNDGDYIIAGFSNSTDGNVSGNHGDFDAWVVKTDSMGDLVWQKSLGGSSHDEAFTVMPLADGGYILCGYTASNDGDVSGNHGNDDGWIAKLDASGNVVWQRCLGGSSRDRFTDLRVLPDGGFIAAGMTTSTDGDVTGNHGLGDAWVLKLDSTGNLLWQHCVGGSGDDNARIIRTMPDGGFILAGRTYSNDGDISGNHGDSDALVAKLDASGNIVWQMCYGGSGFEEIRAFRPAENGFIFAGTTASNDGDVSGNHGGGDAWIVKLNGTGGFYQPTLSVVPQVAKINLGGSRTYDLSLSSLPNGLAGYNVSVSLSNPAVSEITGLALPAWAFLNSSSLLPGDSIWFGGLDLNRTIEPGATDIPLGTVTVRGDSVGSTALVVQVLEMDADGGGVLTPVVIDAQLNVYEVLSANYQVNITSGSVPLTVMFTDMSTGNPGPSSWSWNFGDGSTSAMQNPVHTFTSGGSFTVTLAVANEYDEDTIVPSWNISVLWPVAPFPGYTNQPTDQDGDGLYEDINGNGRPDFDDVVAFYLNMQWVRDNASVGIEPYDFNGNGRIDYDDVVLLYWEVLGA